MAQTNRSSDSADPGGLGALDESLGTTISVAGESDRDRRPGGQRSRLHCQ